MTTKEFDLYSVLAVTHGLPSDALTYRTILAFLCGKKVEGMPGAGQCAWTVRTPCRDWLLEQHPEVGAIPAPPQFGDDEDAMDAWAAEQATAVGFDRLQITPVPAGRVPDDLVGEFIDKHPLPERLYVLGRHKDPADG